MNQKQCKCRQHAGVLIGYAFHYHGTRVHYTNKSNLVKQKYIIQSKLKYATFNWACRAHCENNNFYSA